MELEIRGYREELIRTLQESASGLLTRSALAQYTPFRAGANIHCVCVIATTSVVRRNMVRATIRRVHD